MPVEDHPIHEKTIKAADARYGCYNHPPYSDGYMAPNRIYSPYSGNWTMNKKFIPHQMSTECKFDMSHIDRSCEGCIHAGGK